MFDRDRRGLRSNESAHNLPISDAQSSQPGGSSMFHLHMTSLPAMFRSQNIPPSNSGQGPRGDGSEDCVPPSEGGGASRNALGMVPRTRPLLASRAAARGHAARLRVAVISAREYARSWATVRPR